MCPLPAWLYHLVEPFLFCSFNQLFAFSCTDLESVLNLFWILWKYVMIKQFFFLKNFQLYWPLFECFLTQSEAMERSKTQQSVTGWDSNLGQFCENWGLHVTQPNQLSNAPQTNFLLILKQYLRLWICWWTTQVSDSFLVWSGLLLAPLAQLLHDKWVTGSVKSPKKMQRLSSGSHFHPGSPLHMCAMISFRRLLFFKRPNEICLKCQVVFVL